MTRDEFEFRISAIYNKLLQVAGTKLPMDDVEDAVQSTILSAWEHLAQLNDEKTFEPWVIRILLNRCAQIYRSKKTNEAFDDALLQCTSTQEDGTLREALDQMNPSDRNLLLLHHEQGYSINEISHQTGHSEAVLKMRLYRARKRLRVILISLLLLLLLMSIAVGTGKMDIPWFLNNRRAKPAGVGTNHRSAAWISYSGRFLQVEISDTIWELDTLSLYVTYDIAGTGSNTLTVHNGNIGVDGERQDHIWIDDRILPVDQWAQGQTVYTYFLDGWRLDDHYLTGSEDYLPDGKGDAFFAKLNLHQVSPEQFEILLADDGTITLQSDVFVRDFAAGKILEHGMLTVTIEAPSAQEWRSAYEAVYH